MLIGKYARQKAKRLTSLADYRKIVNATEYWLMLENDNGLYRHDSVIILSEELALKLEQGKKEIAEIVQNKA